MRTLTIVAMVLSLLVVGCGKKRKRRSSSGKAASSNVHASPATVMKALGQAIAAKDIAAARALFPSDVLLEAQFPGEECEKFRGNLKRIRHKIKRIINTMFKRAAGRIHFGESYKPWGDSPDVVTESQIVGIKMKVLKFGGDKPVRTKVAPAGTVEDGCTFLTELTVEKGHEITFQAEKDGKIALLDEDFDLMRFGAHGYYVFND
jgi:hypothetical protein